MNRILSLVVALLFLLCQASAQKARYFHKLLSEEGCEVRLWASSTTEGKAIVVSMTANSIYLTGYPMMMLKTSDGDVLTLQGTQLGAGTSSYAVGYVATSNFYAMPIYGSEVNSSAMFPITDEQIELLRKGISKIRLSTVPIVHEREFRRDKIGRKLRKGFDEMRSMDDDF